MHAPNLNWKHYQDIQRQWSSQQQQHHHAGTVDIFPLCHEYLWALWNQFGPIMAFYPTDILSTQSVTSTSPTIMPARWSISLPTHTNRCRHMLPFNISHVNIYYDYASMWEHFLVLFLRLYTIYTGNAIITNFSLIFLLFITIRICNYGESIVC